MIHIYTDGSCISNPNGAGGWAIAIIEEDGCEYYFSDKNSCTTNNRMELLAAIKGLEALKLTKSEVTIVSDSKYVVDAINQKWIYGWLKKNWKDVKNSDLWVQFWKLYQQHVVTMKWIKGHNAHVENERCDVLATQAADEGPHAIDAAFEALNKS